MDWRTDDMAILKVARLGHPVLRKRARLVDPAEITTPGFQQLIDDMYETMHEYDGVGLAAPQVHEGVRLMLVAIDEDRGHRADDEPVPVVALINPEIKPVGREVVEDWEGCLSLPRLRGRVRRPNEVKLAALDRDGKKVDLHLHGYQARVVQHEADHLDGVLFIDRMKSLETLTYLDEYAKYWAKD
jgi:peptide deformylase